jgi:hypothetical protein
VGNVIVTMDARRAIGHAETDQALNAAQRMFDGPSQNDEALRASG